MNPIQFGTVFSVKDCSPESYVRQDNQISEFIRERRKKGIPAVQLSQSHFPSLRAMFPNSTYVFTGRDGLEVEPLINQLKRLRDLSEGPHKELSDFLLGSLPNKLDTPLSRGRFNQLLALLAKLASDQMKETGEKVQKLINANPVKYIA